MKTLISTILENKNNVVSLYKIGSQPMGRFHEEDSFGYCISEVGDWPNKMWTSGSVSTTRLDTVAHCIKSTKTPLTYTHFDLHQEGEPLMVSQHFQLKSELIAMSLSLDTEVAPANDVCLRRVASPKDAYLWCEAFYDAFGYTIAVETILQNYHHIPYYLCFSDGQVVGTALLFESDTVVGIHCVGVIPSYRGKGIALQIMRFILHKAKQTDLAHATLQASAMGIGLYKKLGFKTDFTIYNYKLKH